MSILRRQKTTVKDQKITKTSKNPAFIDEKGSEGIPAIAGYPEIILPNDKPTIASEAKSQDVALLKLQNQMSDLNNKVLGLEQRINVEVDKKIEQIAQVLMEMDKRMGQPLAAHPQNPMQGSSMIEKGIEMFTKFMDGGALQPQVNSADQILDQLLQLKKRQQQLNTLFNDVPVVIEQAPALPAPASKMVVEK